MPDTAATRLLLFAHGPARRPVAQDAGIRRYRIARLRLDGAGRREGEPRYAYLKRSHD